MCASEQSGNWSCWDQNSVKILSSVSGFATTNAAVSCSAVGSGWCTSAGAAGTLFAGATDAVVVAVAIAVAAPVADVAAVADEIAVADVVAVVVAVVVVAVVAVTVVAVAVVAVAVVAATVVPASAVVVVVAAAFAARNLACAAETIAICLARKVRGDTRPGDACGGTSVESVDALLEGDACGGCCSGMSYRVLSANIFT